MTRGPSSADNTVIVTAKAIDYGVSDKRAIAAPRMGDAPHVRRGRRVPAEADHSSSVATARRELKRSGTSWNVSRSGTQRARGRSNGPGRGTDDHGYVRREERAGAWPRPSLDGG